MPNSEPVQAMGPAARFGNTTGWETGTSVETHCAAAGLASKSPHTTATTHDFAVIQLLSPGVIGKSNMLRRLPLLCYGSPPARMERPKQQSNARYLFTLSLGALGVVYGDIGTSPLYAFRECFRPEHHLRHTEANILGIVSLITWSLVIIISLKYLLLVMRADNRGEGGILALMSLVGVQSATSKRRWFIVALGLFGAALLYGDGMITPAISVLSAVEGLDVATPVFKLYIVPITLAVLVLLFVVQRVGTAKVGAMFGPVMMIWFAVIAVIGVSQIVRAPHVLTAIDPRWAVRFFTTNHLTGYLVLGAVFLAVTGGEALYADMGHLGA